MMIDRSVMQKSIPHVSWWMVGLVGALFAAVILKLWILAIQAVPFNSDEAIVALMGRHILQGERPIFFYGQAYMGSLDAFLVAGVFRLIGFEVWGIRFVQILLYSGTVLTTAWLGNSISGKWQVGVIAAWLLAIPTVSMTLYTTVSMGGYGETLLIGNLILLLTIRISREPASQSSWKRYLKWLALGFLCGFGLWVFGLTLVYSVPALLFLAGFSLKHRFQAGNSNDSAPVNKYKDSQKNPHRLGQVNEIGNWGSLFVGVIIGALPWLVYAVNHGFAQLVFELSGGAIAGAGSSSTLVNFFHHGLNFFLFGLTVILGLRPSWEVRWLGLPFAPFVLAFWVWVIVFAVKKTVSGIQSGTKSREISFYPLLGGVVMVLLAGFIISPFGADPSGRYFLPISVILAVFAADAVWRLKEKWGIAVYLIICLVLVFNLWGVLQTTNKTPPGITTQIDAVTQIDHGYDRDLIKFLKTQGELFGYSNYWVSYPLAFLTDEQLVYVPRLPYHPDLRYTSRDDRYKPYQQYVAEASKAAYITTNNPQLDEKLRSEFSNLGIEWKETLIGDYQVFYALSEKIEPLQIGLGGGDG